MPESISVRSADGSLIGVERRGDGPPLVLVHGSTADRFRWAPVVDRLAQWFTVDAMDRRGRGLSTAESEPYALEREAEDVAAVVQAAGEDVYLVGHSYGAICCLEAALLTPAIGRMTLYEPPIPTAGRVVFPPGAHESVRDAAASGDRERILTVFFERVIQVPSSGIDAMRSTPMWQSRLAAAHTLVREGDAVNAYRVTDRLSSITVPVRLLLGTESPDYYLPAAEAVRSVVPQADIVPLSGQAHLAIDNDPDQFLAAVLDFAAG